MADRLLTADQVKRLLNITDFRSLSKEKLIEFVSVIPDMDKEVAIKIIEQFPEFSNYAQVLVSHLSSKCDAILKSNDSNTQAVMTGYKSTLDTLGQLAVMEKVSAKDRRYFAEKMVEVTDKMAAFDANNKRFLADLTRFFAWFIGGGVLIGSVILGVHINVSRIAKTT